MKYNHYKLPLFLLLAGTFFLGSCSNDSEKSRTENTIDKPTVNKNPFRFYKDIELRPGLNFEILSWGKAVDSVGGYLLLMSDSTKSNFKSLSVERKGIITDAWNMDMDNDGNPELYIQLLSKKNVLDLNVYEYAGGSFNKISFPALSANQKKGYSGNDKFYIKSGDLFRSFPASLTTDSVTKNITKIYQYHLSGNSFSTTEVKEQVK